MGRVSKRELQQSKLQEIIEHFSYLITTLHTSSEIDDFLYEFLTHEEKKQGSFGKN